MRYTFASRRQLSFVVAAGGRNLLVSFGDRNQAGISVFTTADEKVAHAIRRHSLSRRGIIQETTVEGQEAADTPQIARQQPVTAAKVAKKPAEAPTETQEPTPTTDAPEPTLIADAPEPTSTSETPTEREYDNYTIARENICKEFGIKKNSVRNPEALSRVAKEHGIIIKYKDL